jgi:hypothetical protein
MKNLHRLALLICCFCLCGRLYGQSVRLKDSSDWWSTNNEHYSGLRVKTKEKSFDTRNFGVLGLSLDTLDFDKVVIKLGRASVVERGDASTGRSQLCYVSDVGSKKIHLVFELGEGQSSTFYLFRGGADWKGSDRCFKTNKVSMNLSTVTGLRLGLQRAQIEAILGKPDFASGNSIAYSRQFYRKATKEEFERSRREYPETLTDETAHQEFDLVNVTMQLEARFEDSRLYYIYISTDSLNDN